MVPDIILHDVNNLPEINPFLSITLNFYSVLISGTALVYSICIAFMYTVYIVAMKNRQPSHHIAL